MIYKKSIFHERFRHVERCQSNSVHAWCKALQTISVSYKLIENAIETIQEHIISLTAAFPEQQRFPYLNAILD